MTDEPIRQDINNLLYIVQAHGELKGVVTAMVARQDRNEAWMGDHVKEINSKLDRMMEALANNAGKSAAMKAILSPVVLAAIGVVGTLTSLAVHFILAHVP